MDISFILEDTVFLDFKNSIGLLVYVNDKLKSIAQIKHFRHCSSSNFIANSLSAIAAYCFFKKELATDVNFVNDGQLFIF